MKRKNHSNKNKINDHDKNIKPTGLKESDMTEKY